MLKTAVLLGCCLVVALEETDAAKLPANGTSSRSPINLPKAGDRFYLGIFLQANWYRAMQYCRYHGLHLASIQSQEENDLLERHIKGLGLSNEHFWTSGTDQGEEGVFFWMSTGRTIEYENWIPGEPNNIHKTTCDIENCLELWNRDGRLKWNDEPCAWKKFFICEE